MNFENPFQRLAEKLDIIEQKMSTLLDLSRTKSNSAIPEEELLDVKEASKLLKLSIPTIYSKVSRKELPRLNGSKKLMFLKSDLLDYLMSSKMQSVEEIKTDAIQQLTSLKTRKGKSND